MCILKLFLLYKLIKDDSGIKPRAKTYKNFKIPCCESSTPEGMRLLVQLSGGSANYLQ